jgi:hypothetical protein
LNPAQLTAQARDVQRISDLSTIKSAIAIYLSTASSPALGEQARSTKDATCGLNSGTCTVNATTTVDGNGWVGVDFSGTSGGSPLASLPLDPSNTETYQYAYNGDNTSKTFELNTRLESTKYAPQMATDGGDKNICTDFTAATCYYEIGTQPGLNL